MMADKETRAVFLGSNDNLALAAIAALLDVRTARQRACGGGSVASGRPPTATEPHGGKTRKPHVFPKPHGSMGEKMSPTTEHVMRSALALRNFFSARCAAELAAAVPALCDGKRLSDAEAKELEHEFNRLFVGSDFVGSDVVPAPLFASVYLENQPRIPGRSALEVRELFCGLGLAASEGGVPNDFLPCELEAWLRLCTLDADLPRGTGRKAVRQARRWLVLEHMALWLPGFMARTSQASSSPVMAEIMKTLGNWLRAARENL